MLRYWKFKNKPNKIVQNEKKTGLQSGLNGFKFFILGIAGLTIVSITNHYYYLNYYHYYYFNYYHYYSCWTKFIILKKGGETNDQDEGYKSINGHSNLSSKLNYVERQTWTLQLSPNESELGNCGFSGLLLFLNRQKKLNRLWEQRTQHTVIRVPLGQLFCPLKICKGVCVNPGQSMVGFSETQPARSSLADFQWARKSLPRGGFLKISFSRHSDLRRPTSTLRRPYVDPMPT